MFAGTCHVVPGSYNTLQFLIQILNQIDSIVVYYFPKALMPHSIKGFLEINKDLSCSLRYFSTINLSDTISWIVPLPGLNPACSSHICNSISFFIWLLVSLLEFQMRLIVKWFSHLVVSPFFGLVTTRDFVHSIGNAPVVQILLQILCMIWAMA